MDYSTILVPYSTVVNVTHVIGITKEIRKVIVQIVYGTVNAEIQYLVMFVQSVKVDDLFHHKPQFWNKLIVYILCNFQQNSCRNISSIVRLQNIFLCSTVSAFTTKCQKEDHTVG